MGVNENRTNLLAKLGIAVPIVQAPMAGWATPALAAAVSGAGALGSIGLGGTTAESARALICETRLLTDRPFSVNVFCHVRPVADPVRDARWLTYLKPHFARFQAEPPIALGVGYESFVDDNAMLAMLLEERPAAVSFHFGLPHTQKIEALRNAGIVLMATATNSDEAGQIAAAGIDVIVAQGIEAGGHRGMFDPALADERLGTMALVRLLLHESSLPVVAAGGIMDGAGIAAALRWAGQGVRLSRSMPAAELVAILAREMISSIKSLSANS